MDTSATLAADLVPKLIKEKLLMIAEKDTVFFNLGEKGNLPEGQGKTVQFTRYNRLRLPRSPAIEGQTPGDSNLSTSTVQAVVDQWIQTSTLTDVAILTVRHPVLQKTQSLQGTAHAELVDRECQIVLMGGTNVVFGGVATSRDTLIAGDVMTTDLIRKTWATLRHQGAPKYEGNMYVGVVDPFVKMDVSKDSTFVTAASYSNIRALLDAEIGHWMGVRWMESNLIPIITLLSAGDYAVAAVPPGGPGEVPFAAGSTELVQVNRLDDETGFETEVGAVVAQAQGAPGNVSVTINAVAPTGDYKIYVSLENGIVPTLQTVVSHVVGVADVFIYTKAGTPAAAGTFVVQATGAVAVPPPPADGGGVHISYILGKEAFGVTDLAGLETFLTPYKPSDSDPAVQRRKVSWKQLFKPVILNPQFFMRMETRSAFD